MKKLRIAQFVTCEVQYPIPPDFSKAWAPIQIATEISQSLTERGHEVIYFGPRGSKSNKFHIREFKNITPIYKNQLAQILNLRRREKILGLSEQYIICEIFKEHLKKPFNIIHIHSIDRALPLAYLFPQNPVVYTLHDPTSAWRSYAYQLFQSPSQYIITISDAQRKAEQNLRYFATVYNGINLKLFPFSNKTTDNILLVSRLNQEKGVCEAIKTAKTINKPLKLIGPRDDPEYWQNEVEPILDKKINYIGFVEHNKLYRYFGKAKVFLMPIMWEEPFGLVVPEANACGTPVVAFARGSMPELIKDGYNGFLVKPGDVKAMAKAVQRIYDLPEEEYRQMRRNCRKHVEENFTVEKMVDNYERVYQQIIAERSKSNT